jgi:SAM-dependent methyltransferase
MTGQAHAHYDTHFYEYNVGIARRAALVVCPYLFRTLRPASVLDVGCGRGGWLAEWQELGVRVRGLDRPEVSNSGLLFSPDCFEPRNLNASQDVAGWFDLVECMEVVEHLEPDSARRLIEALGKTSDIILFSAAPPGQGGENHINEQPYEYWRTLWNDLGFQLYDAVRPVLRHHRDIAPWYRYNLFLVANEAGANRMPAEMRATAIGRGEPVRDIAPLSYRLRRLVVRLLPRSTQDTLARVKGRTGISKGRI